MEKKIKEGTKYIQEAEKHLKTGFLKWKPDHDSAAAEYLKAAVAFKNGEALEKAKSAYESAAASQLECNQLFHAAKSYEQAAFIAKDQKDWEETVRLIERASNMYLENGTPDTAVLSLARAAKMVESSLPDKAVNLYMKAAWVHENEGRPKQAADAIRPAPRLLLRTKRYDEAVNALQKEINYNQEAEVWPITHRLVTCMVLLHLYRGDCVAADKAFKHGYAYNGFGDSDDCQVLEQLLDAMNQGDENAASSVLNMPLFKYLDNDYAKLARDLRENPPDGIFTTGSGGSGEPINQDEEEDEYADGLC